MQIELAVIADAANVAADGKLNVLGMFNRVNSPTVPFAFAQMTVVLKFVASPGEKGSSPAVKIILVDQDGARIFETTGLEAPVPRDTNELNPEISLIVVLQGLTFQKFGPHIFDVLVNGSSVKQIPFSVQPIPPAPTV